MVSIESINPGYNGKPILEGNKGTLGKDDFLTLLTVQMQNQDPFKPMDPSEFTAQLTQFEELEQLFNISESLEYLTLYQNSLVNTEAMNFIDKTIKALGNSLHIREGSPPDIHYDLTKDAQEVTIKIYDSDGYLVRLIEKGFQDQGEQKIEWDGRDNQGEKLPDGEYLFEVSALDFSDDPITVLTCIVGKVDSLMFSNGICHLMVEDELVPIGDVIQIQGME